MSDVPIYRIQAYVRARRETRRRTQAPAAPQAGRRLRLRRVRAQIKIIEGYSPAFAGISPARVLLSDFTPTTLRLFTPEPLRAGLQIALTLENPRPFYAKAVVVEYHEVPTGDRPIITPQRFGYRVTVKFLFDSDVERDIVKHYCEKLRSEGG